jgi:hypothetical protein
MSVRNQKESLYRQIVDTVTNDPEVGVTGPVHQVLRMDYANVTGLREEVRFGLYMPGQPGLASNYQLTEWMRHLAGILPSEGLDPKTFNEITGKIHGSNLKYTERIGSTRVKKTTEYLVTDPDFRGAHITEAKPLEETSIFSISRIIYIRPFPNQALAQLYADYHANTDVYQCNSSVVGLDYLVSDELLRDAEKGNDLSKYLVPKVIKD